MTPDLKYLRGYPAPLVEQVRELVVQGKLASYLAERYPERHAVRTDKALYHYALEIKQRYLRNVPNFDKVAYDSKLGLLHAALGINSASVRIQGLKLKARKEIKIASLFKEVAPEFLRMIVVHELAHLKEPNHDKAFYQLCEHMQPRYHQLEFDLRLLLTSQENHPEASGAKASDSERE